MSKPNTDSAIDQRRARLISELESTNQQLHVLRQKSTELQQELAALKNNASEKKPSSPSKPSKPAPSLKKSMSTTTSKARSPKPLAPEDDRFLMEGVSD